MSDITTEADALPLVAATRRFAHTVLKPAALAADRDGVKRAAIDQIRSLGLLNHRAPSEYGGGGLSWAAERRIHEHLSYGCLNTWLIWGQHAALTGKVVEAAARGREFGELGQAVLRGEVLLGAGLSDVRGYPRRFLNADRTNGGWLLSGTLSWATGWGLNDAFAIGAVDARAQTVVVGLARLSERVRATPLDLHALAGSHTFRLELDEVFMADQEVIEAVPLSSWQRSDRSQASNAGPHYFGVAAAILDELRTTAQPLVDELLAGWEPHVARLRRTAYALADAVPPGAPEADLAARAALKAATGNAITTLAQALVVARSGRAMAGDNTAQLHARNALFLLVQGQTANVKEAQLTSLLQPPDQALVGNPDAAEAMAHA